MAIMQRYVVHAREFSIWDITFRLSSPGGRYSTEFYTKRLRPEVQPFTLLYTIFGRKGTPFRIHSIDKWYPFHILSLKLSIPLYCRKFVVF